ncbi:MAG: hypothetical protein K2Z81_26665, partial [Cyanobacteria bacterium]|nr:hypothetical protein [Cyanobacteriota bacterium]
MPPLDFAQNFGQPPAEQPLSSDSIRFAPVRDNIETLQTTPSENRWSEISADIWSREMDLPQQTREFLQREQERVQEADKLDHTSIRVTLQVGLQQKTALNLEMAKYTARGETPPAELLKSVADKDVENWQRYEQYLSPAERRAAMAFALISSGRDRHIKMGENLLLEAVALRPALQFNKDFQ